MGKVLIKCIQTPMQKYFYDRSLDSVVMVNDEEYQILKTVEKTKLVPDGVLRRFVKSGLLRETAIEEIEHPETENLHLLAEHYMGNLILQVTQQCNLRCKYCAYSGNYYNRSHTSNRMDFETAKKAIDFYLKRSEKADQLALSFYGGEPLLEFELIKKCVSYIENIGVLFSVLLCIGFSKLAFSNSGNSIKKYMSVLFKQSMEFIQFFFSS